MTENAGRQARHGRIPATGGALLAAGIVVTATMAWPVHAQQSELSRCLSIPDIAERVRCYDAIARAEQGQGQGQEEAQARTAPVTRGPASAEARPAERAATAAPPVRSPAPTPAPAVAAASTAGPAAEDKRQEFGLSAAELESRRPAEQRQLDALRTTISSAKTIGAGFWQFVTSDGAVWRMTEMRRSFRPPEPGDEVVIRRGTLGSYYIDVGKQPALPIKRIG